MASENTFDDFEKECKKSRKCSKPPGHKGRCNVQKPINLFWESTNTYKLNERKRKLQLEQHSFEEKVKRKESELANRENLVLNSEVHLRNLLIEKGKNILISQVIIILVRIPRKKCSILYFVLSTAGELPAGK